MRQTKIASHLSLRWIIGIIVILWILFTVIYSLNLNIALGAVLEFVPAGLAIGILVLAGFKLDDLYLRIRPISRQGFLFLAAFLLLVPPILLSGHWIGFDWQSALIFAPASGIAQELFFRAALLPVLIRCFDRNIFIAVLLQSLLFSLWHLPKAFTQAPVAGAIGVTVFTFIGGMLWGWQVQRDKSVIWAMIHHILLLVVMSLFIWE
jgi:membrane protease YdiL (CAAX protease family)